MIDIENYVYTQVYKAIKTKYPKANVSSQYVKAPTSFPHVSIIEEDNYIDQSMISTTDTEHSVKVMYSVNIYVNDIDKKKNIAKDIANIIDNAFQSLRFRRALKLVVPNMDNGIYRMTMRFNGTVSKSINGKDRNYTINCY